MSTAEREGKGRAKHFKPFQQLFTANNKIQKAFEIVTNQEGECGHVKLYWEINSWKAHNSKHN